VSRDDHASVRGVRWSTRSCVAPALDLCCPERGAERELDSELQAGAVLDVEGGEHLAAGGQCPH
jgi:hypothetical protein